MGLGRPRRRPHLRARPDLHRRSDALRHAAVDDQVVPRPRLPRARRRLRGRRSEPLRRPPRRLDAAQRAQRQRRLLRPARCVAAVPHRRGRASSLSPSHSPRASSPRSGRSCDVQPDASFVYVEAAFRYAGDTLPDPEGDSRRATVRGPRPRPRSCRRRPSDPRLAHPPRRRHRAARTHDWQIR